MKRTVMTAACIAAVAAVMLGGCGGGQSPKAGAAAQPDEWPGEEVKQEDAAGETTQETGSPADAAAVQTGSMDGNEEQEQVQLAGTTFSVLGDSISTYRDYNPEGYAVFFPENGAVDDVENTWWQIVSDELELMLYANGSSSGSTVAGDSTGTEDPRCGCNELRTNDLSGPEGACPDRIVIFMGTNDVLTAVPLGDNDGTRIVEEGEVDSFSDAYTLMLDKLQANYPLAEIYCCTLLPMGDYGTQTPYVEFVNSAQLTSKDYGETIVRIAGSRGISVIDLNDCGITIDNLQEMTTDGVHPTVSGMRCIAEAVEEVLAGE